MSAWLNNPPSSGTLAFSLRLAPSLPAADFPAFHTGYSASPPLAYSPFLGASGASSAILSPYCLLRHKTIDVLDRGGARELYFNFIFEWVQDCGCPLNLRPETPKPKP